MTSAMRKKSFAEVLCGVRPALNMRGRGGQAFAVQRTLMLDPIRIA